MKTFRSKLVKVLSILIAALFICSSLFMLYIGELDKEGVFQILAFFTMAIVFLYLAFEKND